MSTEIIIDNKYRVTGLCSDSGGMGCIYFVTPIHAPLSFPVVLKLCRESKDYPEEYFNRFRREVRTLTALSGNPKIVQIIDSNLNATPPYFVMRYYPDGDVSNLINNLNNNLPLQKEIFIQIIDCIAELHSRNMFHRDIKPENFLLDHNNIVVSDFGLLKEIGTNTNFTQTIDTWGTKGYTPPEFESGEFKYPDATSDIYMLGKTFYALLTGDKNPTVLHENNNISPMLYRLITMCCQDDKNKRFQTILDLKNAIISIFQVLLNDTGDYDKTYQLLKQFSNQTDRNGNCNASTHDIENFLIYFIHLNYDDDLLQICLNIQKPLCQLISQPDFTGYHDIFLNRYGEFVESTRYTFEFAETIAKNMAIFFASPTIKNELKVKALDNATKASMEMNRFNAMNTCLSMIASIKNTDPLGSDIASYILTNQDNFYHMLSIADSSPTSYQNHLIANAFRLIRNKRDEETEQHMNNITNIF